MTRGEYLDSVNAEVDQMLTIVYALLGLAIVIAVMGIANTISLAVHERTRELGLLRAVGQSRRQTRTMVRWESVMTAVFGTLGAIELHHTPDRTELRMCSGQDVHSQTWHNIASPPVESNHRRFVTAVIAQKSCEPSFRRGADLQKVLDLCQTPEAGGAARVS
jgi:hypothetical protein